MLAAWGLWQLTTGPAECAAASCRYCSPSISPESWHQVSSLGCTLLAGMSGVMSKAVSSPEQRPHPILWSQRHACVRAAATAAWTCCSLSLARSACLAVACTSLVELLGPSCYCTDAALTAARHLPCTPAPRQQLSHSGNTNLRVLQGEGNASEFE